VGVVYDLAICFHKAFDTSSFQGSRNSETAHLFVVLLPTSRTPVDCVDASVDKLLSVINCRRRYLFR
jgi:hypothetical protein